MNLKNSLKIFLNKQINPPYQIISLGVNCYAKTFLTKRKFKKKKDAGELTLPFDFTFYTNAKYITEFIQNDFSDYFEELYFIEKSQYWGKARKIFFSHETDFKENDKEKLVEMYSKRIKNFYSYLSSDKPVLFFQILTDKEEGEDLENLFCVLKQKIKPPFILAVVDCDEVIERELPKEICVLKLQKPAPDYDFYSKKCYKSSKGKEFENKIEKFVSEVISKEMKQRVVKYF
ncbi:hypothetical protein IKQ26_09365 [bacterium]|nr:hypothetical protein [bacterium]